MDAKAKNPENSETGIVKVALVSGIIGAVGSSAVIGTGWIASLVIGAILSVFVSSIAGRLGL